MHSPNHFLDTMSILQIDIHHLGRKNLHGQTLNLDSIRKHSGAYLLRILAAENLPLLCSEDILHPLSARVPT